MAFRNIIVENPARISVRNSQLVIKTDAEHSLPIEDISALIIESRQSTITAAALSLLGECGCCVFMCDEKHTPCAVLTPFAQHSRQLSVMQAQLSMGEVLKKRLWQSIVKAKLNAGRQPVSGIFCSTTGITCCNIPYTRGFATVRTQLKSTR